MILGQSVYESGPVPLDPNTCETWIYPRQQNYPLRQYQLEITETAVLHNTLVSLPTGLGKTLIAAVVVYNYYRWFPEGKVIFLAPTLPLVSQQAEACYKIMGIPEKDTALLTGRLKPSTRFEMWRSRRVFYCTPQTVQKDLLAEDGTSFASKVCCIVLDEAHKASGDYAYTKVIEQLELAGAQFRIVGLSATPGTSIKAIQKVVDALRIVKIEARDEADPSVSKYIHQKHSEIVTVEKNESQKDIERRLTRLLDPVLSYLKAENALKYGGGNATLTSFQIHKSKQEYLKQHNGNIGGALFSYFQTAYKLIELRNEAHQSLGCVLVKIQRLKQTPQRGVLSTILKSKDFEELYQKVLEATGTTADGTPGSSIEISNPKLKKLGELLNEHFSRAKAGDKSSRAIVFSQFRDSVAEIVDQLEKYHPLIRARHFVGQQGSKRPTGGDADNRLRGMKQSEQQEVIQRFRDDFYNVLVCTCIGEEGLDIGEVDLIVNFDTLRSPIRMIQRTGRTGRKRDGRVVCLVSEGQEERTHKASKEAEKTLMRALKKTGSFKMAIHKPMLPGEPSREYADIEISSRFRLSQVGHPSSRRQTKVQNWKLTAAQEEERSHLLGKSIPVSGDWNTLRSVFLRGWCGRFRKPVRGQMKILQKLNEIGPLRAEIVSRRSLTCGTEKIFPIVRQHDYVGSVEQTRRNRVANQSFQQDDYIDSVQRTERNTAANQSVQQHHYTNSQTERNMAANQYVQQHDYIGSIQRAERDRVANQPVRQHDYIGLDQRAERDMAANQLVQQHEYTGSVEETERDRVANQPVQMSTDGHENKANETQPAFRLPTPPSSSGEEDNATEEVVVEEEQSFCFRLPTQDSSSSSSSDEESEVGNQQRYLTSGLSAQLDNTPDSKTRTSSENIECAICCSGESTDNNPIVLCDGGCNRGFHKLCCSVEVDLDSTDPWLCQQCAKGKSAFRRKRLIRKRTIRDILSPTQNIEAGTPPVDESEKENSDLQRKKKRLERLQARRSGAARFVLDEAEIDASDDMEGDDAENAMVEALEQEENLSNDSFINNATQLSQHYSDDELGNVDPGASRDIDFHQRNLDAQADRDNQFKTPILNRRAAMGGRFTDRSETSSQEGLGNMHFIRSVLQHHQQGGNAQEIETYFRDLNGSEQSPGECSSKVSGDDHSPTNKWPGE